MFSLFKAKPKHASYSYHTFMTAMEKYWMLLEDLKETTETQQVALVYYFLDTQQELIKLLDQAGIPIGDNEVVLDQNVKVTLWSLENAKKQAFSSDTTIMVAEILPLKSTTLKFVSSQSSDHEITFYASLDSVFFEIFGSDRLKQLMKQLGLKENERIQHSLVTKSIERAQEKVEKTAKDPMINSSIEEWAKVNL